MNLSEFIEETLSEILAGVRAVQSKEGAWPSAQNRSRNKPRQHDLREQKTHIQLWILTFLSPQKQRPKAKPE
jgi:hypothetical protein